MEEKILMTFDSVHQTMKAESLLKERGISSKTIPTPREITASCGLSLLFDPENLDQVRSLVDQGLFLVDQVWTYTMGDKEKTRIIDWKEG